MSETHDTSALFSRFSTQALPKERQLLAWRDRVGHVVDVIPDKDRIARGFAGSIDLHAAGGLVFTEAHTDALTLERSIARVSTDTRRDFAFHVYLEGETGNMSGVGAKRSDPGSVRGIVALDLNQRFRIERPRCRVLTMFVPRAMLAAHIDDCDWLHGRVVAHEAPLARIVFDHFDAIARELPSLERPDAIDMLDTAAHLLIASFAARPHALPVARVALQNAVKAQVKRYVETNLHEGDLTPTKVVEALGLKRATIYRWFEQEGGLGAYIRHRRLREAADELARFPNLQIADIAFGLGFKSASDFTRAFRRAFDASPQEMRLRALDLLRATHGNDITRMRVASSETVRESGSARRA
ncbi:helix-turn-helix transcriptional regulator [Caballeronia insecticola]|uniref:helix-turn-helix transcriptional regulator n=1 Tax=Caballeronia insecticola TaxID=758793 RepID=UPI0005C5D2BF|nr:helix-turn-helix transcriptional regulator [Caballeronia insecticola]